MTELAREPSANQSPDSPELGFSLGLIPAGELAAQLKEFPFDETGTTEEFYLEVAALSDVFSKGLPQSVWRAYVEASELSVDMFEDSRNAEQVTAAYGAFIDAAAKAATMHCADYLEYINSFITRNPELIKKDPGQAQNLEHLYVRWDAYSHNKPPHVMPAVLIAQWSDGTVDDSAHQSRSDVLIDMEKTSEEVRSIAMQYRQRYKPTPDDQN